MTEYKPWQELYDEFMNHFENVRRTRRHLAEDLFTLYETIWLIEGWGCEKYIKQRMTKKLERRPLKEGEKEAILETINSWKMPKAKVRKGDIQIMSLF